MNTLKFGNGEWYGKKDTILAYNDLNSNYKPLPFNFSRASKATVVNKDGLIQEVGSGQPRIDYKDDSKGALLLEPSRTNLIEYSIPINSAPYNYANGGVATAPIHTANQGISPDGSLNASKIDFNLNGGTTSSDLSQMAYVGSSLTGDYTSSFYLKSFDSNSYIVTLLDSNGATSQETITPEWQRFTFYNGGGTTSTNLIRIRLRGNENTSNTASLLAWGFQLESGSYATSAIFTSGSTVTRSADSCSQTVPDGVIGQTEGSVYVEVNISNTTTKTILALDTGSASNFIILDTSISLSPKILVRQSSGSFPAIITGTAMSYGVNKIAFCYKSGDYAMYVNGVLSGTSTSATFPSGIISKISVGANSSYGYFSDTVKNVKLYDTRLSNSELAALTQV